MSEAAHWLKTPSNKGLTANEQKRMKAAKVNRAEYIYPEYLMLCKLVRRVTPAQPHPFVAQTP